MVLGGGGGGVTLNSEAPPEGGTMLSRSIFLIKMNLRAKPPCTNVLWSNSLSGSRDGHKQGIWKTFG